MSNLAIAFPNLADSGTVTADTFVSLMPPSNLKDPHIARKWRGMGTGFNIIADLGSVQSIDTVAMFGLNLTTVGSARVRASASDPTALSSLLYDSSTLSSPVDPNYKSLIVLLSSAVSVRYVRVSLADTSLTYAEAGRIFIGKRTQFTNNFEPGWQMGYIDRSRIVESRAGQQFIDRDLSYRFVDLSFPLITEAERIGIVETLDREAGQRSDVLLLTNPASSNLGRDSIWGLIKSPQPTIQPHPTSYFAKRYRVEERL
jgi:hypothetical protein